MAAIQNIILDWSGTLVDDLTPVLSATNALFNHYGKPSFTVETFRAHFCLPFSDFYRRHLPEVEQAEIDLHYHRQFRPLQAEIPLLPFARDFLDYCRERKMPIFLLSTIHQDHFAEQSARLGVASYFQKAYTDALDKRQAIRLLLETHHLDPAATLFIGDMAHDIEAARHGGVRSCAVLTGYDPLEKLKGANPDLLFQNLQQVRGHLEHQRHCQNPHTPPVCTVGALVYNRQGEVLMIQTFKWSHLWGIPGGKIEGGETALDAIRREIREETGLELEADTLRFALVQDCIHSPEFYKKAHFLLLNYTAQIQDPLPRVVLNEEADRFCWVSPEAALRMELNHPTRTLLDYVRSHPHLAFTA